ncbi:MAG: cyclic nucleotide-binding domain-containing protein [Chloroflexota bacterium]
MDIVNILKQVDIFRGFSDEQREKIVSIIHTETFSAGATICKQGDSADKLYIISSGQVEILTRDSQGEDTSVVYLGIGQTIGEMTLVDEGTRSATVVAVDDPTQLFSIENDALVQLCETNTGIGFYLMRNIAQDLSFKLRHNAQQPHSSTSEA